MFLDRTAVHDINGVVGVAHEWHVQRLEGVCGVVELVQVHLARVLVPQTLHDPFHLRLRQVHAVAVQQPHQVQRVDETLVGVVNQFEEFVHVVVVAADYFAHCSGYFE